MRNALCTSALVAVLISAATFSHSRPIAFDLRYSGAEFGNSATAVGNITFDEDILPNPGFLDNVTAETLGVTSFSITVSGASTGNGVFGLADVTNWIWAVPLPLNLEQELFGQPGFADFNWCAFLFDGCVPPAPGGISPLTIQTNAETGDLLSLVSMRPAQIAEPTTALLFGLVLMGFAMLLGKRERSGDVAPTF